MRSAAFIAVGLAFAGGDALAQAMTNAAVLATSHEWPAATPEESERDWSFSASVYGYFVPDNRDYAQPTISADRGWLHLESRYNYEDLDTGSIWMGYNFSFGEKLSLEFTPMLGGVFGNTNGIAPGYRATLNWRQLELYREAEYVFDTADSSDSFFYTWSELTLSPMDWFRFGLVIQRTKVYETNLDIQRGLLVGFAYKQANFTTYVFNPDQSNPTAVVSVGLDF